MCMCVIKVYIDKILSYLFKIIKNNGPGTVHQKMKQLHQVWLCTPIILTFERLKQGDLKLKVSLGYTVSLHLKKITVYKYRQCAILDNDILLA